MAWVISDEMKDLVTCSAVYGMLGQFYSSSFAAKEHRKSIKRIDIRYQAVSKQFSDCVSAVSEKVKVNSAEIKRIREEILLARREKCYQEVDTMKNWEIGSDYAIPFKYVTEECGDIQREVGECVDLIEKTTTAFDNSKTFRGTLSTLIFTSWAGLGGFPATGKMFHTKGLFAFCGAMLGSFVVRFIRELKLDEEAAMFALHIKLLHDMVNLLEQCYDFTLLISLITADIKAYERLALRMCKPLFCSPTCLALTKFRAELGQLSLDMAKGADILQAHFQGIPVRAKQTLLNLQNNERQRKIGSIRYLARISQRNE